jgi:hypothetical protein
VTAPDEPPPIAELVALAEDAMVDYLVAKSQALQPDGCCADPSWRGHLCQYHLGYRDGMEELLDIHRTVGLIARQRSSARHPSSDDTP